MDTHHLPDPTPREAVMINARFRAASAVGDLARTFHTFDAERFRWLAAQLSDAGRPEVAKLALEWSNEHAETARRLADLEDAA